MDYTEIMYDAAHEAYRQNNEVHAYTGLVRGLAAVARELGFDLPWQYFSDKHHDSLVSLADIFGKETISFEELVRMWDKMWFGLGTGRFTELPYPFGNPDSVHVTSGYHPVDLSRIKSEVQQALKKLKIWRGTKKHEAFITENAQEVLDAAARTAATSAEAKSRDLKASHDKIAKLYQTALDKIQELALEAKLRDELLRAAGLEGSAVVTSEMDLRHRSWTRAAEVFSDKLSYIERSLEALSDPNKNTIEAVETMSRDDVLAPFARAAGLIT